ncbi:unnamed protein product [Periconia digitata]|uniref:DUF8004 domain-containing protein n=1 Tax=Periconia digitata TaxID=1303443 RepID=A0A9W4UFT4_9PLEO|nr:unnamed protein product [Periconia digitata]
MSSGLPGSRADRRLRSSSEGPGHRSSLQSHCAAPFDHAAFTPTPTISKPGQTLGPPTPTSCSITRTHQQPSQSLVHQRIAALECLNGSPIKIPSRSQSFSAAPSTVTMPQRPSSCSIASQAPLRPVKVQRWDGKARTVSDWDGLRRDSDLWFENGNCLVHLYARGQSRRGASFCVPFKTLTRSRCRPLFDSYFPHIAEPLGSDVKNQTRIPGSRDKDKPFSPKIELYIPAPASATKEEAFEWHLTTRNFFAYIFSKPLVGKHLGRALVNLEERISRFCSHDDSRSKFLSYAERQGYRDYVDCPDYALAMLYYGEHYKLRSIWIDAFAHCVGMNESLPMSPEYMLISSLTKALIVRAYLEMDIHLGRATAAVREFLMDDVSPTHLGLSEGALAHIDRFRSFLQGFYIEKFGYWPPPKGVNFPKVMFQSMYHDFKNLYDYLVDPESTADFSSQKPASGGICVLQNIESFDKRHKFPSLPHPLPLLPKEVNPKNFAGSPNPFRAFSPGPKHNKSDLYMTTHAALTAATNRENVTVTSSSLVQEYQRFEKQWAHVHREEKISTADARKARWILIYGTLQYLVSTLRAPKEVRDTRSPKYPLCCLVVEQSPWQLGSKALTSPKSASVNTRKPSRSRRSETVQHPVESIADIQPDCHREQYFTHTNTDPPSRRVSVDIPAPLKISQLARNTSLRSIKRLSFSGSRNSVHLKSPPHHEIMVRGYGNGLNETTTSLPLPSTSQSSSQRTSMILSNVPDSFTIGPNRNGSYKSSNLPHLALDCNTADDTHKAPVPVEQTYDFSHRSSPKIGHSVSSSSNSTGSSDSPLWSDGASASSSDLSIYSQADVYALPHELSTCPSKNDQQYKTSHSAADTLSGKATQKVSSDSSRTPITYGEFSFGFDTTDPAISSSQRTPYAAARERRPIGLALTAPATPISKTKTSSPIKSMSSNESLRSLSAESLYSITQECMRVAAAVEAMPPLRADPSPSTHSRPDIPRPSCSIPTRTTRSSSTQGVKNENVLTRLAGSPSLAKKPSSSSKTSVSKTRNASVVKSVPYSGAKDGGKPANTKEKESPFKLLRMRSFWRR